MPRRACHSAYWQRLEALISFEDSHTVGSGLKNVGNNCYMNRYHNAHLLIAMCSLAVYYSVLYTLQRSITISSVILISLHVRKVAYIRRTTCDIHWLDLGQLNKEGRFCTVCALQDHTQKTRSGQYEWIFADTLFKNMRGMHMSDHDRF